MAALSGENIKDSKSQTRPDRPRLAAVAPIILASANQMIIATSVAHNNVMGMAQSNIICALKVPVRDNVPVGGPDDLDPRRGDGFCVFVLFGCLNLNCTPEPPTEQSSVLLGVPLLRPPVHPNRNQ